MDALTLLLTLPTYLFFLQFLCYGISHSLGVDEKFEYIKTSTKGISSIKPEMGILIIYSYSVIDVRT